MAETELDKQTVLVTDLTRKVDELQVRADEATRLKDQLDEWVSYVSYALSSLFIWDLYRYRHAADKLQKTENVMEKYKKKLQEAADMRQQVKVIYLQIYFPAGIQSLLGSREAECGPCGQECCARRRVP